MKRKNFLSLLLGIGALSLALGMNYRYANEDYGIKTNSLSTSVWADTQESTAAKKYCNYITWTGPEYADCTGMPGIRECKDGDHHMCDRDKSYKGTSCKKGFKGVWKDCNGNTHPDIDTVQSLTCP